MISNIEEIKSKSDIVEVISSFVKLKTKGANLVGLCPFHSEKSPSFTVSKSKQMFKCFGCGKSGDDVQFLMDHENINYVEAIKWLANKFNTTIEQETKIYEKPPPRLEKLPPETIQYFESRGISNNTLLRLGVTQSVEWMPIANKEIPVICFNYIRNGELVNIKYRGKGRDFRLHKNSELIFYNLDAITDEDSVIITEGEIDCLSLHEAGIYNAVSVPNGASTGFMQLKYLDNCWQHFEDKKKIIIFTDNDKPGLDLQDEIARRLGKERCYKVIYPEGCKDANDVLVKHGKPMLTEIIEQAKRWPMDGVITMDDVFDTVVDYYEHGYPKGCEAGIGEFDSLLTFTGGQMTVVTGAPNMGKSEFVDYLITSLSRRHNWKFTLCSFENPVPLHVTKLMEKFVGLSFAFRKDPAHRMQKPEFEEAIALTDQYFSFLNVMQVDVTIEGILSKLTEVVRRTGIRGVVIDPWNYIEHKVPPGYTETQYISEALTLIREFAVKCDVHVFIVAHPRKLMKEKGKYPPATMYDISGSAHFFNKTDNGISIHRDFETGVVTAYVQKVRFSWLGKIGFATYTYNTYTRQYEQL